MLFLKTSSPAGRNDTGFHLHPTQVNNGLVETVDGTLFLLITLIFFQSFLYKFPFCASLTDLLQGGDRLSLLMVWELPAKLEVSQEKIDEEGNTTS